jgi:hypothetical protein
MWHKYLVFIFVKSGWGEVEGWCSLLNRTIGAYKPTQTWRAENVENDPIVSYCDNILDS